jgi:hypothetical protein
MVKVSVFLFIVLSIKVLIGVKGFGLPLLVTDIKIFYSYFLKVS